MPYWPDYQSNQISFDITVNSWQCIHVSSEKHIFQIAFTWACVCACVCTCTSTSCITICWGFEKGVAKPVQFFINCKFKQLFSLLEYILLIYSTSKKLGHPRGAQSWAVAATTAAAAAALLRVERSQMMWLRHLLRMPPWWGVPSTSHWEEAPGHTGETMGSILVPSLTDGAVQIMWDEARRSLSIFAWPCWSFFFKNMCPLSLWVWTPDLFLSWYWLIINIYNYI